MLSQEPRTRVEWQSKLTDILDVDRMKCFSNAARTCNSIEKLEGLLSRFAVIDLKFVV
jgi:hypothetical protein